MTPRRKSSLLWGLVGTLTFLVLALGYALAGGQLPVGPLGLGGIAVFVGVVVAVLAAVVEPRLRAKGRT
ncbi:MAG: hypothetical protein ABEH60_00945 [Halonotius sp.]